MKPGAHGPIALDPRARIVAGEDQVHLWTRTGNHRLEGRQVGVLFRRLEPHLDGRHDEEGLLAAVPPAHGPALRSLLSGLRETGALFSAEIATGGTRSAFERALERVELRLDRDGAPTDLNEPAVVFLDPATAGRWLLRLDDPHGTRRPWTCLVVVSETGPVDEAVLRRRGRLARWLRGTLYDPDRNSRHAWLFHLGDDGELELWLHLTAEESGDDLLGTIVEQMDVVQATDVDQLPLVVLTASHPVFPARVTGYGLRVDDVRRAVAREVVLRCRPEGRLGKRGLAAASANAETEGLALAAWTEIDLLSVAWSHPDLSYLRGILALRRRHLVVQQTVTPGGTVALRHAGRRPCVSRSREHAVAQLLLEATWSEYYADALPNTAAQPVCPLRDFLSRADREQRRVELREGMA